MLHWEDWDVLSWKLSIAASEVGRRLVERLQGSGATTATKFLWQRDDQRLLVHADSLAYRFVDGWLICNLDLETDQTQRQTLQFVFFLGESTEGDGLQASCTINAPSVGAAQLAAGWGEEVQRVLWDAVLDAVEAAVYHAETLKPGVKLTVGGFHCTADALHVQVLGGDR